MNHRAGILVIDDDEDHLFVARRALQRSNVRAEVRTERDGVDALRLMGLLPDPGTDAALPPRIDMVMLDLRIPGMSGWEILRRIRQSQRTRGIPVVIISSSHDPDDIRSSFLLGANSYVVKRFEADRPGGYLVDVARYWVELNEGPRTPEPVGP